MCVNLQCSKNFKETFLKRIIYQRYCQIQKMYSRYFHFHVIMEFLNSLSIISQDKHCLNDNFLDHPKYVAYVDAYYIIRIKFMDWWENMDSIMLDSVRKAMIYNIHIRCWDDYPHFGSLQQIKHFCLSWTQTLLSSLHRQGDDDDHDHLCQEKS